jgi:hypothetical protein
MNHDSLDKNPSNVLERLHILVDEKKLSGRQFAISIGLQPSSGGKILGGITKLSQTLANSIELVHGYSAKWLLTGELPKYSSSKQLIHEQQLLLELMEFDWASFPILLMVEKHLLDYMLKRDFSFITDLMEGIQVLKTGLKDVLISQRDKYFDLERELRETLRKYINDLASTDSEAALEMLLLIFEEERNLKPNYPDVPRDKYLGRSSGAYSTKILNIRGKMREFCELTLKEKKLIEEARTAHLLTKEE